MCWVGFVSQNNSNGVNEIRFPDMNKKEESKEYIYATWERMMKRHVIFLHKQTFESQMLSKLKTILKWNYGQDCVNKPNFCTISISAEINTYFFSWCIKNLNEAGRDSKWIMIRIDVKFLEHQTGKWGCFMIFILMKISININSRILKRNH